MHGLHSGAQLRRFFLVGVFMVVTLALATRVTAARADTPNTITQTAITSPSDPSYFYDPTDGAYGGITVSGTTNSTASSSDTVDIECYTGDDGDTAASENVLAPSVSLNTDGSFSTTVPYSAFENLDTNMCRLRAVPTPVAPNSAPNSGLSAFQGPRVLLATLSLDYNSTQLNDFSLVAPQLGATNSYDSVGDCGLYSALLNDQTAFGALGTQTFNCADTSGLYYDDKSGDGVGAMQVDGVDAWPAYNYAQLTVSATQDPSNGDMTITESDPITADCNPDCYDAGVRQDRTIRQAANGHVVEITDTFRSTDGAAHAINLDVANQQCFTSSYCGWGSYDPSGVLYEFPGESTPTAHVDGYTTSVGATAPGTIYIQNSGGTAAGAITYFTAPSGPVTFAEPSYPYFGFIGNILFTPYQLAVPAGGSVSLSYAYSSEASQGALSSDVQVAQDLQTLPTVSFSSPAAGSTTNSATVTATGQTTAVTGVSSVTVNGVNATVNGSGFSANVPLSPGMNTLTAVVTTDAGITASASESVTYTPPSATPTTTTTTPTTTTTTPITPASQSKWAGPVWLPIADTGQARRAGLRKERLTGRVTPGSGLVKYFFEYGTRGHLNHRTATIALAAGEGSRPVASTIGGLRSAAKYTYRLVAAGTYGRSAGRNRTFKTTAHNK